MNVGLILVTMLVAVCVGYGGHVVARDRISLPIQAVVVLGILALPLPGSWIPAARD